MQGGRLGFSRFVRERRLILRNEHSRGNGSSDQGLTPCCRDLGKVIATASPGSGVPCRDLAVVDAHGAMCDGEAQADAAARTTTIGLDSIKTA